MNARANRRAGGLPEQLWKRSVRLVRPRDAADIYRDPAKEFARFTARGWLVRLASGYFALVPPERVHDDPPWRPPLADAGWAIGAVDYGIDLVAICGPVAARYHGLLPRATAAAHIAVPKQRPSLPIGTGFVRFTKRDVTALDVERIRTELGDGWVTGVEQTALDLTSRPARWDLTAEDVDEALRSAVGRIDSDLLLELSRRQRRGPAAEKIIDRMAAGDARS